MKSLIALLIIITAGLAGCAQTAKVNDPAAANKTSETAEANTAQAAENKAASPDATENECKICDFDFAAYKGDLDKKEVDGLLLALNDEYMATAIYKAVNEKFGDPRPFVNIVKAEETHADRLKGLFEIHKIPVPENPWFGKVPVFETVTAACEAGVKAEIINRDLYNRLFESTKRDDIITVYKALQRASEENHLPAFERCGSGGGRGMGRGNGRRGNN